MRRSIVSLIAGFGAAFSTAFAPTAPARADGPPAIVIRPQPQATPKPAPVRRVVRAYRYHSPLYAFYPPTVIRDGRSYFYYPQRWRRGYASEGIPDRLAEPVEEPRHRYRHRYYR
jgi:hypothetical protein